MHRLATVHERNDVVNGSIRWTNSGVKYYYISRQQTYLLDCAGRAQTSTKDAPFGYSARAWQPTNDQRRHDTAYLNKRLFY